jgi:Flp pilus assembly protein TadG
MLAGIALKKRALRRFARARNGAAALEFALVAVPFFLLIIGLAEVSMIGFAQTSLNFAVSDVARDIRTGRAQLDGATQADMESRLCDGMGQFLVLNCEDNLFLDVNRFDSFLSVNVDDPIQNDEFDSGGFVFQPGAPADIVVVRAYYRWRVITPMFESAFQNVSGGERVLSATMMFRNEPYQ